MWTPFYFTFIFFRILCCFLAWKLIRLWLWKINIWFGQHPNKIQALPLMSVQMHHVLNMCLCTCINRCIYGPYFSLGMAPLQCSAVNLRFTRLSVGREPVTTVEIMIEKIFSHSTASTSHFTILSGACLLAAPDLCSGSCVFLHLHE